MESRRVGADPVELLRGLLLAVLVIGLLGTVTELVLLNITSRSCSSFPSC